MGDELKEQHAAIIQDALESDAIVETSGDIYDRVISGTPDITRDLVRHIVVSKHNDETQSSSNTNLPRTTSEPTLSESPFPDIARASELQQPQGFRRDYVQDDVNNTTTSHFLETLLEFNSNTLYAWVEHDLDSDSDVSDDEDDEIDRTYRVEEQNRNEATQRRRLVYRSYGPNDLLRRNSDLQNEQSHLASDAKTLLTLFKCFVATGILFIPSGFKNAGLFAGVVIISTSGISSYFGMMLLLDTVRHLNSCDMEPRTPLLSSDARAAVSQVLFPRKSIIINTYSKVGGLVFGYYGRKIIETSILFSQIGFCCVYISFTGKSLRDSLNVNHVFPPDREWPLWLYMMLTIPIVTPLTFIRHLAFFATPNLIANIFVVISLGLVLITALAGLISGEVKTHDHVVDTNWNCTSDSKVSACLWINSSSFMMFLGTAVYAFEGVTMVIPVQNSMQNPEHLPKMLLVVMATVSTLFGVFGSVNFYAYGQETEPVILANLPPVQQLVVTCMFVVVAIFMFPLMIFPAARIIEKRFYKKERRSGKKWQKNFIRTNIVIFCVLVGVFGGDKVDKLVSVIGGAFCVPLALIFPPLLYLKSGAYDSNTSAIFAILLCTFGIFSAAVATVTALQQW